MEALSILLIIIVAFLHFYFLILEMFWWKKPIGLKVFRMSTEEAKITAPLAANQGLYNGFLAAGLIVSLFTDNPDVGFSFQLFFLVCIIIAGAFGALSVSRKIFLFQSVPALLALAATIAVRF